MHLLSNELLILNGLIMWCYQMPKVFLHAVVLFNAMIIIREKNSDLRKPPRSCSNAVLQEETFTIENA